MILDPQPPTDLENKYVYVDPEILDYHDGDTLLLRVELPFDVEFKWWWRFAGIDAPEVRGRTKAAGLASRAHLVSLLDGHEGLIVRSHRIGEPNATGARRPRRTFVRYVGQGWVRRGGVWANLSSLMLDAGHADPYDD